MTASSDNGGVEWRLQDDGSGVGDWFKWPVQCIKGRKVRSVKLGLIYICFSRTGTGTDNDL